LNSGVDTDRYAARKELATLISECNSDACAILIRDLLPQKAELLSTNYRTTIGILTAIANAKKPFTVYQPGFSKKFAVGSL
jgi:hypothetical protein